MRYLGRQRHCAKADSLGRVAAPAHIGVLLPKISPRTRLIGSRAPNKDRTLLMWATTGKCL